jgi:F-type H+-transporting ATPase subunit gamma
MGAQLRVYRQKIKSAQTTKKITRAMELISASRILQSTAALLPLLLIQVPLLAQYQPWLHHSNIDHPLTTEPEKPLSAQQLLSSPQTEVWLVRSHLDVLKEVEQLP